MWNYRRDYQHQTRRQKKSGKRAEASPLAMYDLVRQQINSLHSGRFNRGYLRDLLSDGGPVPTYLQAVELRDKLRYGARRMRLRNLGSNGVKVIPLAGYARIIPANKVRSELVNARIRTLEYQIEAERNKRNAAFLALPRSMHLQLKVKPGYGADISYEPFPLYAVSKESALAFKNYDPASGQPKPKLELVPLISGVVEATYLSHEDSATVMNSADDQVCLFDWTVIRANPI